ncbi:PKIP [Artaxa digramma nucleopolyhedrovirus]|uniref:PKIP n=1 Tax=Artaxa digramma nucleopolyhedrovirus TaxID=3070910 RepID=A0AAE6R6Q9_9ABAC|nr:PKIP [Euproctis digramma nucleopolyhedrovirus]QHB21785.1 PKIP [Artaxa digramma nucleopolyhedrovirus]
MDAQIETLKKKINKYINEYQTKTEAFFRKGSKKNCQNLVDELYVMSATLFGLDEQVYSISNNACRDDQIEFINNLIEFGFSNELIENLYNTKDYNLILTQYMIADDKTIKNNYSIYNMLISNCKKFINVLCQFVDKRNAYRKKANDSLLEELVLLKATLVKHLCIIQKLASYKSLESTHQHT